MRYKERILFTFLFSFLFFSTYSIAQEKPEFKLGGALRFNYNYSDWKEDSKKKGGDFGFDVFRLNLTGGYKKILFDAEYRFYANSSGGHMLKHGWFGYEFNENHQIQVGLTQVPFGVLPVTSNNFFFNLNYYLGLEDDYDMGVKYLFNKNAWNLALAFFKNSDILDFGDKQSLSPNRYSYDVGGRDKEVNQGNIQINYTCGNRFKQEFGLSGMLGGIYNMDTEKMGLRKAFAVHYSASYKNWDVKAQYTTYAMSPKKGNDKNGNPIDRDFVTMGAYGANYNVARKADTYLATIAYTIPVNKGILDNIRIYNDFSMMHKRIDGYKDSYQNVSGILLTTGPVFTYIDYALGKNHSWFSNAWDDSFAQGDPSNKWNARFNINMGYYF
ncbi:hypothetical protein [Bacteroides coprosuis]|uniref:hypothetical protein n=1 Tax=Bacteroides coprosuis TaxID=151276 RepID=UPI001D97C78F|nr:hypothetical protein [Bacteroides coprosuis]HJD91998.1 hypothetical protein [Bacteroides coprosuis]